ncbi:hypothetical protein [Usitatibacter palustris]|uniref:DUF5648 domain-containing protein n=1 Tax=Usitatibacter palustris TaxID=2732487 RepID=A0A6M4H8N4_9PROT|nr:hypothetical protein [Usitatibacter palustris]QJR15931.1 hypothetical protein DSM104440_02758 [Usitatibacter palustris]
MKTITTVLAALFALLSMPVAAETIASPARPTAICNVAPPRSYIGYQPRQPADPLVARMFAAATDPSSDPALHERLAKPTSVTWLSAMNTLVFDYESAQDPQEIAARIRSDPELAALILYLYPSNSASKACFAVGLPVPDQFIREYYHPATNHYYMSASAAESTWIDSGGAGAGWVRTGHAWTTRETEYCDSPANFSAPVYMFYGTPGIGPNSHYFTASAEECGYLRNTVGWTYVAAPFGAGRPDAQGKCPALAPVGLTMLYNNRAAQNDSNHRYTSDPAVRAEMVAKGWTSYGVQLCVKANGVP